MKRFSGIPYNICFKKKQSQERLNLVEKEKALEWCDSKGGMVYFETSAKEKINVDEAFLDIVHKALSHVRSNNKIYKSDTEIGEVILSKEKIGEVQARRCAC